VNISAVIIVISVIAGILLVIFISCLCYCCCRCRAYRRAQAKKQGEKWNFQQELKRAEMQNRHSLRTKQREQELESYRIKYGNKNSIHVDYVGVRECKYAKSIDTATAG
ncbi:hypothetical protein ANCDUO_22390, partial [Ancylostoma duodenale]